MSLPNVFYAEPRFRASSPDFEKLRGANNFTLDTPGIGLALAIDYYKVEAFANRLDRDRSCGPTAHPDVQYFPINRDTLVLQRTRLDEIACGLAIGHRDFNIVLQPIFDWTLELLIRDATKTKKAAVISTTLTIARARYTVSAKWKGDWLDVAVDAFSAFEEIDGDVMDRTMRHLSDRLALQLSPKRAASKAN